MNPSTQPDYHLGKTGEFIIENYNLAKPFASFFPGIAGPHGIPMWAFYVNRGQCLCSLGIEDKEHPIMEFLSANRAYQLTANQGFRTFIKLLQGKKQKFYEPFQNRLADDGQRRRQRMIIRPAQLTLEEENATLGLKFSVDYFNVPEDAYAGLIRILRIQNLKRRPQRLEGLDGLPLIIPFGVDNYNLKNMRRLVESFVEVTNLQRRLPFFKGKVKQEDRPEVIRIKAGNFYAGFEVGARSVKLAAPVVDPEWVFDGLTDYAHPARFLRQTPFKVAGKQILENRLPCALAPFAATLGAGATFTFASIIGHAGSEQELNRLLPPRLNAKYLEEKRRQNAEGIERLTQNQWVHTSAPAFNLYCRQNFLDNVLRGGLPVTLRHGEKRTTLHLYSRKHGDLERDYNDYRLSPTPYSQGNGNFRDVNQNRRSDLFFNPDVEEGNVEHFYDLLQLDGFNPLVVKATRFSLRDREAVAGLVARAFAPEHGARVLAALERGFAPGELLAQLAQDGLKLKRTPDEFLSELLAACDKHQETDYGHGFWSDHWTYNLDLVENYLALYPEKLRWLLLEKKTFTFFDNHYRVAPRRDKYVVWEGNPMQLQAVVHDAEKEALIGRRSESPNEVRTQFGSGKIYRTTLVNKLLCLVTNKLASLDPEGVGLEMESDKPNWYDALNGLPGLLGSSLNESLELKRHILFLLQAFQDLRVAPEQTWLLFKENYDFMTTLARLLQKYFGGREAVSRMEFWDQAATAKERYRDLTRLGISGEETAVRADEVREFLQLALRKLEEGLERAWDPKRGVPYTYFINRVAEYEEITLGEGDGRQVKRNARGLACFRPKRFQQVPLPLFLEGPVHTLRTATDPQRARALAGAIQRSGLYDRKLKMYKVNESLADQPMEIGRTKIFSPGWLENESIWMHMEYKYLLELLRAGLAPEFYSAFTRVLVPFLDPATYGRSILENSSFIASSANPDPKLHGTGFVARLSGSTAEFIHILLLMTVGARPFRVDARGELSLRFEPVLPAWLFTRREARERLDLGRGWEDVTLPARTFSFMFLGRTLVVLHNPKRRATYGPQAVGPQSLTLTFPGGATARVAGPTVTGDLARRLRNREAERIDVHLG